MVNERARVRLRCKQVSPLVIQLRALGKGKNPFIPPSYELNSTSTVLLQTWVLDQMIQKG